VPPILGVHRRTLAQCHPELGGGSPTQDKECGCKYTSPRGGRGVAAAGTLLCVIGALCLCLSPVAAMSSFATRYQMRRYLLLRSDLSTQLMQASIWW